MDTTSVTTTSTRTCAKCGQSLPATIDHFHRNKARALGLNYECRDCVHQRNSRRQKMRPEKLRAYRHDKIIRLTDDLIVSRAFIYQLKFNFGLTGDDYARMYTDQNGACAICITKPEDDGRALCVDHDHATGKIRGLLCHRCNQAIGLLKESVERLKRSIDYLERGGYAPVING